MVTIRSAKRDDLNEVLERYQTLNPADPELDRTAELEAQWSDMLASESLDVLVVEHDDRLVSTCVLSITPNLTRGGRPWAVIENVVTHEDYQGEGYGKQVVQKAIDRAAERDCYKVMLLTGTDEEWKRQFYESCGFDRDEKTGFVRYLE